MSWSTRQLWFLDFVMKSTPSPPAPPPPPCQPRMSTTNVNQECQFNMSDYNVRKHVRNMSTKHVKQVRLEVHSREELSLNFKLSNIKVWA